MSQDGRYIYASNRDNSYPDKNRSSIAVFKVDTLTGNLTVIQITSSMGEHPRHFDLFFGGTLMVVANMNSDNIVSFAVNTTTGLITPPDDMESARVLRTTRPTQVVQRP